MKRAISILIVIAMFCMVLAGCGTSSTPAPAPAAPAADGGNQPSGGEEPAPVSTTWGIEPMSKPVKINLGYFSGAYHSSPWYVMESKGWLDELGISLEYFSFISGPVMMEASNNWDICTTGAPGAIPGMLNYDVRLIGFCDEEASINMYVRPDSKLAQSGQGHFPDYPKMYGTQDDWKGLTVLLPVGTTAHQSLVTVLEEIGLTVNDVTMQNMDVTTALTAFKGGEGDMISVWTSTSIEAESLGYVRAASSRFDENHVIIPTTLCATDKALNDPLKHEAILKLWELYYRTLKWEKENLEEAAKLFAETCAIEGVSGADDYDLCYTSLKDWFFPKYLDEMIELMTTKGPDPAGLYEGEIGNGYNELFNTFDFFMSQQKYTIENRNFLIENNKIDSSIAEEVAAIIAAR